MSTLSRVKTWNTADTLTAADLNAEFDNIVNDYNGTITNANISASAAIDATKLNLTKPQIKGSYQAITADSDSATITFNLSASNVHTVTLGGARTLAVSNATAGQCFLIRLIQGTGGSHTATWWATIKWPSGTAPTLTTTEASIDAFVFVCTGTGTYDGYFAGFDLR
jgi:hypothetical protein